MNQINAPRCPNHLYTALWGMPKQYCATCHAIAQVAIALRRLASWNLW